MRFGLVLEYNGGKFHGSQLQPNVRTVQGELELALSKLFKQPIRARFASRTDVGTHAFGQTSSIDVATQRNTFQITKALNFMLPDDLKVRLIRKMPTQFEPRRDALKRTYVYRIVNSNLLSPFLRNTHLQVKDTLNHINMNRAASMLVGTHNFQIFTLSSLYNKSTTRKVFAASVTRQRDIVKFTVSANAFLYKQIRITAAYLVAIGLGEITINQFQEMLNTGKQISIKPLPANGLCLISVTYDENLGFTLPQSTVDYIF